MFISCLLITSAAVLDNDQLTQTVVSSSPSTVPEIFSAYRRLRNVCNSKKKREKAYATPYMEI